MTDKAEIISDLAGKVNPDNLRRIVLDALWKRIPSPQSVNFREMLTEFLDYYWYGN